MPRSVLIVDDEPGVTAALMARLEAAGFEVFGAINGLAAVEAAELRRPDAIILDIRMPDIDGYEVCARIKQQPELRDTPIVFLSANVQESTRRRAFEVGGAAFISKPYEAAEVIDTVNRALQEATTNEEITHG